MVFIHSGQAGTTSLVWGGDHCTFQNAHKAVWQPILAQLIAGRSNAPPKHLQRLKSSPVWKSALACVLPLRWLPKQETARKMSIL